MKCLFMKWKEWQEFFTCQLSIRVFDVFIICYYLEENSNAEENIIFCCFFFLDSDIFLVCQFV